MSPDNKPLLPGQKGGLPVEIRLLIAFALMGLVIFATPYFYKTVAPPAPPKKVVVEKPKPDVVSAAPTQPQPAAPASAARVSSAPPATAAAASEETFVLDTAVYNVVFSNRGAVVKSWTLKNYRDRAGKPLELVNTAAAPKLGYPFALDFRTQKPPLDLNQALYLARPSGDGLSISYEFSDGRVNARKTFEFQRDGYMVQLTSEVTQNGSPVAHLLQWRGGFGDMAVKSAAGQQHHIRFDVASGKLVNEGAKVAKSGPVPVDGSFSFMGIEDQYFTAAFLPAGNGAVTTTIYADPAATKFDTAEESFVGVGVGGEGRNRFSLYVGPKDLYTLRKVNPKLEQIVDFGKWFGFIAKPLFLILHYVNDRFVRNYGWSIIVVTVFINILLFPLKLTNMKSMKKMQALQPQVQEINKRYKDVGMRDPRQAQKNQEMMDLYKKHGANPMGGCLPLAIQMPFLIAFYTVLSVSIELRNASWLWVSDLSQPEHFAIRVLPLLMIATGFIMQKMTPTAGVDPNQQKMMQFMPLMMGFFFWGAQSGLVLYWLTGNLVGIAQQWFFNKTLTPADVAPAPAPVVKKKDRKQA